jgi:hypothetical protein
MLFIIAVLLVPSVVKFTHVFTHHKHEVCEGGDTTHIHKVDLDCEFHKFQLNNNFTFNNSYSELFSPQVNSLKTVSQYRFLSKYLRLPFSLRGPPSLI